MTSSLPRYVFDRWITKGGPERLALLGPTWELLHDSADPPTDSDECLGPLHSLLRITEAGELRLDDNLHVDDDCASKLNHDLGFSPPAYSGCDRAWLEIDALHLLARHLRATVPGDRREEITRLGRILATDSLLLWDAATAALGVHRPGGLGGIVWELMLAWLVRDDVGPEASVAALEEAAEHCGGTGEAEAAVTEAGILSLYSACRACRVFTPRDVGDGGRPRLRGPGRRFAIDALRAAACDNKRLPSHI